MKTVLYTISTLQRSGPSLVLYGLVKNLDRSKFRPVILTLSAEKEISLKPEFEKLGIEIHCLNIRGWKTFFSGARQYSKTVEKIRPDIIHANGFRDIVLGAYAAPTKYFKCATIHCDWEQDYCLKYGRWIGKVSAFLQNRAIKKFNRRIACSGMLADLLNKKYPEIHFDYVDNGVDTDKFYPVVDKTALRYKLGLPADKKIIIWAGSFIPRKDPLTLVKAILEIPENQYYFVFCGARGELLEPCKEMLKHRKDVLFTGYTTDIAAYYQAADMYVSTSLSEGFHLTVYEAMACGMPVILTDITVYDNLRGIKSVGFFPKKDSVALKEAILKCSEQMGPDLAAASLETVQTGYSVGKMAEQYMKIYQAQ